MVRGDSKAPEARFGPMGTLTANCGPRCSSGIINVIFHPGTPTLNLGSNPALSPVPSSPLTIK
jgi:hypothetical protein